MSTQTGGSGPGTPVEKLTELQSMEKWSERDGGGVKGLESYDPVEKGLGEQ